MDGLPINDIPVRDEKFVRALFPNLQLKDYGISWIASDGTVVNVIGEHDGVRVMIDDKDCGLFPNLMHDFWSTACNALTWGTWTQEKWSW